MAKRFADNIRQEHQQTFLAYNEKPRWPPCPNYKLYSLDLLQSQREQVSKTCRNAVDTEDNDQEQKFLPYNHVFSGIQIGEKPITILVEGGAGIGKTALCMLLFKGWENGDFFQKFELLLLLPLRQAKVANARSLPELIQVLFPSHSQEITSYLKQTRGEKVLIIADGLNELTETKFQKKSFFHDLLLVGLVLSQVSILITSRPSISGSLYTEFSCINYFMEIYGFGHSTIHQYIRTKFGNNQQRAIGLLEELETNPLIEQICRIPLNCAVVCFLWQNNVDIFSTTTGFFTEIILNFVYRNLLNTDAYRSHPRLVNIRSLPESLHGPWRFICEIAFQTVRFSLNINSQLQLEATTFSLSDFEALGVLEFVEIDKISFRFVHSAFHEYFAALYLVKQPLDKQMKFFKVHAKSKHLTLFYRFFFGLCFQTYSSEHVEIAGIAQIMHVLSESYTRNNDEYLLCHYAYEAKNSIVTKGIVSALSDRNKSYISMSFGHPCTAQDCNAVMYVIANIQECTFLEIDFHDCCLNDKRMCELVNVLSNKANIVQVKVLNLNNNYLTDVSVVDLFNRASAAFQYIVKLFLRDNKIEEASICAIKATLAKLSHSVHLLDLSNNPLSTDGIEQLQIAIESNSLKNLEILFLRGTLPTNGANANVACLNAFATAVSSHCPQLKRLDLSAIDLGEPDNVAICTLISKLSDNRTKFNLTLNREYMPEVDKRFIAIMEDSMKNKGTIDHTVVHGIFVGPGRSGKDSLMNRLLGKEPHDKSYLSASTGVMESIVKVEVKKLFCTTVAAAVNNLIWKRLDYNEEALELMMATAKYSSMLHDRKSQKDSDTSSNENSDLITENDMVGNYKPVPIKNLRVKPERFNFDDYLHDDNFKGSTLQDQESRLLIVPVQEKWPDVKDILKNAVESQRMDELREHLESSWSLYLTNTGGQMEFQELLPLLVCGPSVFFITFALNKNLMEHYTVQFHHNDADCTEETYQSPSTLMDEILQTLATIDALDLTGYQQDFQFKPKIFFIGTHKDKLPEHSVEKIIQLTDQQIQEKIRQTSLFHQGSIIFAEGTEQLIFTVNNLARDDVDFQKIRCALQQTIEKTDQFTIKCPSTWLIFSLVLRARHKLSQVLTYDECFTIAQGCGISDRTELSSALHFIHTRLGLVRYFNVNELNRYVVIDPQILFDKITDLIVKTFTCDNAEVNEVEDFKKRGIFSIESMERICKMRYHSDSHLPLKWLLKLLSHLRIAAMFMDKKGVAKCFFPAVLCHVPDQQPTSLKNSEYPSLLVSFESGFCPRGIPGALIKFLITNEMNSESPWELIPDRVFKNQVSFSIEGCGDVILKIHPTHLQLSLDPEGEINDQEDVHAMCREVYDCVEQSMKTVTNGYKRSDYFFALYCTLRLCQCKAYLNHPAKVIWRDDHRITLKCTITKRQCHLPANASIWFQVPRQKLDLPLDYTNCGVSLHLGRIADTMSEWEGPVAEALGLTPADIANIKTKHPTELRLQKRSALQMWIQNQGCNATYGKLITIFEDIGYKAYADSVRRLAAANIIEIPSQTAYLSDEKSCHQSSPVSPLVSVSPEMCAQSLLLTDTSDYDDNQDIVSITKEDASQLGKLYQERDIPLLSEHDAQSSTASIFMKHSLKVVEGGNITMPDREPCPDNSGTVSHTDDRQETINAHICFDLEDKPKQLLEALKSIMEIVSNLNIKNIKIGPLQDKVRRIYIENESELSEKEKQLIIEKMKLDGNVQGELEVSLRSEPKSISRTRSEECLSGITPQKITEILRHTPGTLCAFIETLLSIHDETKHRHINITAITIEDECRASTDEGIECKLVTIEFIPPLLEGTWRKSYNEKQVENS